MYSISGMIGTTTLSNQILHTWHSAGTQKSSHCSLCPDKSEESATSLAWLRHSVGQPNWNGVTAHAACASIRLRFSHPSLLLASLEARARGFFLPGSMAFYLDENENHAKSISRSWHSPGTAWSRQLLSTYLLPAQAGLRLSKFNKLQAHISALPRMRRTHTGLYENLHIPAPETVWILASPNLLKSQLHWCEI